MNNRELLPLLGLCKRASMMELGEEPVEAAVRARDARVLLLASDAADNTLRRARHFAELGQCLWLRLPFTKEELGRAMGRTSCAILAVTDIGFAANIVRRLAQADPIHYGEAAERLALKAKRAAERRAEMQAHEKNVRRGKVRKKSALPAEPQAAPAQRPPAVPKPGPGPAHSSGGRPRKGSSRSFRENRPGQRSRANPYVHSLPVKKGKGSFRKKQGHASS